MFKFQKLMYKRSLINLSKMKVTHETSLPKILNQKPDFILFTGSKNPETGISWCPDCTNAQPNIDKMINDKKFENASLVICSVTRDVWKSKENPYKADKTLKVSSVPTLLYLENPAVKLAESQLLNYGAIELFADEL